MSVARCYNGDVIVRKTELSMLELGVKFLISYFIGSLMGSIIVGRLRGGVDIRTMGSGNAGGTNALRTQGIVFALGVVIIDIGKGVLAAGVVPGLEIPFVPADPEISRTWLTLCCGMAAVFGHVWPIYHRFRGGKGAATYVGTLIIINAALIIPLLLVWAWVLVMSGYVGLATMAAAVVLPIWVALTLLPVEQALLIYCAVAAGFIVYWHRSNIERMKAGTEHRNTRLMFFSRKRRNNDEQS
jgi:glycerol-3-phosphate acyltransferase PlsY